MKMWMDLVVAIGLMLILFFGSILIVNLNRSAMQVELQSELAQQGQEISTREGCVACHTMDGSPGVGPSWLGMYGSTRRLTNGTSIVVDEEYFIESIRRPRVQVVEGYPNVMPAYNLPDEELEALLAFARELADD